MDKQYNIPELIVLDFTEWLIGESKEKIKEFNKKFSKRGLSINKKGNGVLKEGTVVDDKLVIDVMFYFYPSVHDVRDIASFVGTVNDGPLSRSNYMKLALVNDKNGEPVEIEVLKLGKVITRFWGDGDEYKPEDVDSSLYKEYKENSNGKNYNVLETIVYIVGKKRRVVSRGQLNIPTKSKYTGFDSVYTCGIKTANVHNFSYYRWDLGDVDIMSWKDKEESKKYTIKLLKENMKHNLEMNKINGWTKGFYNIDKKEELGSTEGVATKSKNFEIKYDTTSVVEIVSYLLDLEADEFSETIEHLLIKQKNRSKKLKEVAKEVMGKSKDRQKLGTSVCSLFTYLALLQNEMATPDNTSFNPNAYEYIPGEKNNFEEEDIDENSNEYVIAALDFILKKIGEYVV